MAKPGIQLLEINDEDMNGFMAAVHKLDRSLGLDLILHTPGGSIASTEAIVRYLLGAAFIKSQVTQPMFQMPQQPK